MFPHIEVMLIKAVGSFDGIMRESLAFGDTIHLARIVETDANKHLLCNYYDVTSPPWKIHQEGDLRRQ